MKTKIYAFSGFLGSHEDWNILSDLNSLFEVVPQIVVPDKNWDKTLETWMNKERPPKDSVLLGYSLGGRMAAQLFYKYPDNFNGLLAISTHPGLDDDLSKKTRVLRDRAWAQKFLNTEISWTQTLEEWDSQAVFGPKELSIAPNSRKESAELRKLCAEQLEVLSLGHQEDLIPKLLASDKPQIWMGGTFDPNFLYLKERLQEQLKDAHSQMEKICQPVPNAYHRWPWQITRADKIIKTAIFKLIGGPTYENNLEAP